MEGAGTHELADRIVEHLAWQAGVHFVLALAGNSDDTARKLYGKQQGAVHLVGLVAGLVLCVLWQVRTGRLSPA